MTRRTQQYPLGSASYFRVSTVPAIITANNDSREFHFLDRGTRDNDDDGCNGWQHYEANLICNHRRRTTASIPIYDDEREWGIPNARPVLETSRRNTFTVIHRAGRLRGTFTQRADDKCWASLRRTSTRWFYLGLQLHQPFEACQDDDSRRDRFTCERERGNSRESLKDSVDRLFDQSWRNFLKNNPITPSRRIIYWFLMKEACFVL